VPLANECWLLVLDSGVCMGNEESRRKGEGKDTNPHLYTQVWSSIMVSYPLLMSFGALVIS